jgi:hypothetical protein
VTGRDGLPRFVTDPEAVIIEAVAAAEPAIGKDQVGAAITRVAAADAQQRRLARALAGQPGLLTSGRPDVPRAVSRLITELLPCSTGGLAVPRCARCSEPRELTAREGNVRICARCAQAKRQRSAERACQRCGQTTRVAPRGLAGTVLCERCHGQPGGDPLATVCTHVAAVEPGLSQDMITEIIGHAIPKRARQRVAEELEAIPGLLTGQGAHGSAALIGLIEALRSGGARNVVLPACPFCARRPVNAARQREGLRCCRACYDQIHAHVCARCGATAAVSTRGLDGEPICHRCRYREPASQRPCTQCGQTAVIVVRHQGQRLCRRCSRLPVACSVCGGVRPCRFAFTSAPRCERCISRGKGSGPCSRCGIVARYWARTPAGDPLCSRCSAHQEVCVRCAHLRRVGARIPEGPLCAPCYRKDPAFARNCTGCGFMTHPYNHGLCPRCALPHMLSQILGAACPTTMSGPLLRALAAGGPLRSLHWLEQPATRHLLIAITGPGQRLTHELLDGLLTGHPTRTITHLRLLLTATGALPPRDEALATLQRWLATTLATVEHRGDRTIVRSFTTWTQLRRLQARSATEPVSPDQAGRIRSDVAMITRFLAHLRQHGQTLGTCTQADIDTWLAQGPPARSRIHSFLAWTAAHGHTRPLDVPVLQSSPQPAFTSNDQRWDLVHRLLTDDTIPAADRVAGLLVLLYAQPAARITQLTISQIHLTPGGVCLTLGSHPVELPPPLADLIRQLLHGRHGYASRDRGPGEPWLLLGPHPGQPASPTTLRQRLHDLGIQPRASRNTALMDLAGQLPAKVLHDMLGIAAKTATTWTQQAGANQTSYAAGISRRAGPQRS